MRWNWVIQKKFQKCSEFKKSWKFKEVEKFFQNWQIWRIKNFERIEEVENFYSIINKISKFERIWNNFSIKSQFSITLQAECSAFIIFDIIIPYNPFQWIEQKPFVVGGHSLFSNATREWFEYFSAKSD